MGEVLPLAGSREGGVMLPSRDSLRTPGETACAFNPIEDIAAALGRLLAHRLREDSSCPA